MRDWMSIPQALNAIADGMEKAMNGWMANSPLWLLRPLPESDSARNSESGSPRSEGKDNLS
jgi:hypothetical protein